MDNQKDLEVGIVSIYPGKDETHPEMGGVASYTKNIMDEISDEVSVTVYANKLDGEETYSEDNVKVRRSWSKFFPFDLLNSMRKNNWEEDVYHIQHEYFLYGGFLSATLFPLLLLMLKLKGKPTVTTIHGIMPLSKMNNQFMDDMGISFPSSILARLGIKYLTKIIGVLSTKIVVHEEKFKERLVEQYNFNKEKIEVIPHPIEEPDVQMTQEKAREELEINQDKKVLLFFGYITGYKGLEDLIKTKNNLDDQYKLIIAGGKHPRRKGDGEYEKYLKELKELADEVKYSDIEFTGFVEEENIPKYFYSADLCVLCYKYNIASSGPRNLAVKYGLPVISSSKPDDIVSSIKSLENRKDRVSNLKKIKILTKEVYLELL